VIDVEREEEVACFARLFADPEIPTVRGAFRRMPQTVEGPAFTQVARHTQLAPRLGTIRRYAEPLAYGELG
jgi:hypothetical protein